MKVSCVYDYQSALGTAYSDNISVVEARDGSAESYTYYDGGMPKELLNNSPPNLPSIQSCIPLPLPPSIVTNSL